MKTHFDFSVSPSLYASLASDPKSWLAWLMSLEFSFGGTAIATWFPSPFWILMSSENPKKKQRSHKTNKCQEGKENIELYVWHVAPICGYVWERVSSKPRLRFPPQKPAFHVKFYVLASTYNNNGTLESFMVHQKCYNRVRHVPSSWKR